MKSNYEGVTQRFLRQDERLVLSDESEMPLVIEANGQADVNFLKSFLAENSDKIKQDMAKYGAVLLRGFDVKTDEDFENAVLSIKGMNGISEAFMSEHGRTHVGNLKYVLHTNSVYKTGGTLYLGGFHSENYYSTDVPEYIFFCCLKPSTLGGETGLVNMEKVYQCMSEALQQKLEKQPFLVARWLMSDVSLRYQIPVEQIEEICEQFNMPVVGTGNHKFILMYKPSVFVHPVTKQKALQINLFELPALNQKMRKYFINDYQGKTWFWHRLVWKMPAIFFTVMEKIYMSIASLIQSPGEALSLMYSKLKTAIALFSLNRKVSYNNDQVVSCFDDGDIEALAQLMRKFYCSSLWQQGDIMMVDNRKVVHAGMPGAGPRKIRAMITNPIAINYSFAQPGALFVKQRDTETVGYYMVSPDQMTKDDTYSSI